MPGVNGLSVSKEVRENNFSAPIVFVTNFQNYAIEGYNVSAIDFAVKPLMYSRFETVMLKIVRSLGSASKTIFLKTNVSTLKIAIDSIYYAESYGHLLYVHADNGTYECWMSLKQFEKLVDSPSFVRINKSIIINLRHISSIKNSTIFIGEATFELSKSKKDSFNNAFYSYINR